MRQKKIFVLMALAVITLGMLAACGAGSAEQELDRAVLQELADAKQGDILRMLDNRVCVVMNGPWMVLTSTTDRVETYEIRVQCGIGAHPEGGHVAEFVPRTFQVIKPTDPIYDSFAGAYLRQRQFPAPSPEPTHTGGIVGGRGVPVQH